MRRLWGGIVAAGLTVACGIALSVPAAAPGQDEPFKVGVGVEDASWHVGASAGQYAGDCPELEFPDPGRAPCTPVSHEDETFDPTGHSVRRLPSYGIQSRLSIRAIVVDGPASGTGDRFAILKNDNYIPQDLVIRRAGQILEQTCSSCGIRFGNAITPGNLTMAVTHDHSSPYYSSTSWGVWTFQDVFDIRFFEYQAQQMAKAVQDAVADLQDAKVGVASIPFDKTHRHSFGPSTADDGTPAGYPKGDTDHDLTVVRFDTPSGDPIANLVNYSLHGEGLEGNDLISADWIAPLERMLDRETDATTVYTQGAVGTSEPERSEWHPVNERLEFSHRDYAQGEFGARLMANAAEQAWDGIESGNPPDPSKYVPFDTDPTVGLRDQWYPGPLTHPYPGVSNCRTPSVLHGDPRIPIAGLPDCENIDGALGNLGLPGPHSLCFPDSDICFPRVDPGLNMSDFCPPGTPVCAVPANYGAPAYTGLEEDIDVHLQAIRIGELLLPICSCEQWWDQSRNIELRTNKTAGDETLPGPGGDPMAGNLGWDWGAQCTEDGNGTYTPEGTGTGTWHCPNPNNPSQPLPGALSDHVVKQMRAQVNNPADGWNELANALTADSEPADATQIFGNYTHDDTADNTAFGYDLTVPISMANDYNGYIATYREFQRGDHYRKALTGWGPHSSDYMASRLASLGRQLKDESGLPDYSLPQDQQDELFYLPKIAADLTTNEARAQALGANGGAAIQGYEASLPDDGGTASAITQPQDIERFGAALFTWRGGSNFTDNPEVKVQRETSPGNWEDYADQSGEIPVTLKFPTTGDAVPYEQGNQQWHWTADFEAMVAGSEDQPFNTGDRDPATPAGNYRFVVHGERRHNHAVESYVIESNSFQVKPWGGILVQDFGLEPDGTMSFVVGPTSGYTVNGGDLGVGGDTFQDKIGPVDYPDSYQGADPRVPPFIRNNRRFRRDPQAPNDPDQVEWFCFTCSFRPWVDFGDAQTANVTVTLGNGTTQEVPATKQPNGRWQTARVLAQGETAQVLTGHVVDRYDSSESSAADPNFNREPSNPLSNGPGPPDFDGDGVEDALDQCRDVAGPPSNNGCPFPPAPDDADGDRVPDAADQCPQTPGPIDNFGCPLETSTPQPAPTPAPASNPGSPGNCAVDKLGTPRADSLLGSTVGDLLRGLGGNDRLRGGDGPDCVFGGRGNDDLDGEGADDLVRGGDGRDLVSGGDGNDVVSGGRQRDRILAGLGDDVVRSIDTSRDRIDCGLGNDAARVGPGVKIVNCERVKRVPIGHSGR